jgi:hypothetical protein
MLNYKAKYQSTLRGSASAARRVAGTAFFPYR